MTSINLAGLQSLDIPPSLFDEFLKYQESAFKQSKWPEGCEVEVDIIWERENRFQTEKEPALAVKLDNATIGYIPVLSTIAGYIQKSREENDLKRYEKEQARYQIVDFIRGSIERDLMEGMPARGKLTRVQIADDTGKVLSVSVGFDLM